MSDLHGNLPKLPKVDLVLIARDLSGAPYKDVWQEKKWLEGPFTEWLSCAPPTIIVGGNHDFYLQKSILENSLRLPCRVLENSATSVDGINIFGTPYSIEFCEWAYQATEPEHSVQSDDLVNLRDVFASPEAVADVILSHGPPRGIGDKTVGGISCGSHTLRRHIIEHQPSLVLTGHIHKGYGVYWLGETCVINCAFVDENYNARKRIPIVDFNVVTKKVDDISFAWVE